MNPIAKIYHTVNAEVDLAAILDIGAFDLVQKLEVDPEFLNDHEHEHDATVGSFVLEENRPIDINRLMVWMNGMAQDRGEDLYRTKGIFHANGFEERLVFQSVRMLTTLRRDRPWRSDEPRMTQFVVIGKNLDRAEFAAGLSGCLFRPEVLTKRPERNDEAVQAMGGLTPRDETDDGPIAPRSQGPC